MRTLDDMSDEEYYWRKRQEEQKNKPRKGDMKIVKRIGNVSGNEIYMVKRYYTFLWWGWWEFEKESYRPYKEKMFDTEESALKYIMRESPKHESHTYEVTKVIRKGE